MERFMDIKDIEKLIKLVEDSGITKLAVEENGVKIEIKKETASPHMMYSHPSMAVMSGVQTQMPGQLTVATSSAAADITGEVQKKPVVDEIGLYKVMSPMVGTYYRSPSPSDPPFIEIGKHVNKGETLCIIEAMKLFNQIDAEESGIIESMFVKNEDKVEFGQVLLHIRKD